MLRSIFGPDLEILNLIGGNLSQEQPKNRVNFHFKVQFDLQGHGKSAHKTILVLTKVF